MMCPLDSRSQNDKLPDGTAVFPGNGCSFDPYSTCRNKVRALLSQPVPRGETCVRGCVQNMWGADAAEFRPERWQKDEHVSQYKANTRACALPRCPGTRLRGLSHRPRVCVRARSSPCSTPDRASAWASRSRSSRPRP